MRLPVWQTNPGRETQPFVATANVLQKLEQSLQRIIDLAQLDRPHVPVLEGLDHDFCQADSGVARAKLP